MNNQSIKTLLKLSKHCNIYLDREQAKTVLDYINELERKVHTNDVELLKALMYAPSSPVSPNKALEIEVWYGKFKQLRKGGE